MQHWETWNGPVDVAVHYLGFSVLRYTIGSLQIVHSSCAQVYMYLSVLRVCCVHSAHQWMWQSQVESVYYSCHLILDHFFLLRNVITNSVNKQCRSLNLIFSNFYPSATKFGCVHNFDQKYYNTSNCVQCFYLWNLTTSQCLQTTEAQMLHAPSL